MCIKANCKVLIPPAPVDEKDYEEIEEEAEDYVNRPISIKRRGRPPLRKYTLKEAFDIFIRKAELEALGCRVELPD